MSRLLLVYQRVFDKVCRRVIVSEDCIVPPQYEVHVPVKMQDNGFPYPPSNWAINPRKLEVGVMTVRMLFSGRHDVAVARVCNYSTKPFTFRANCLLVMAEPVAVVPGAGKEVVDSCLADSNNVTLSVQAGESVGPESSDL